MLVHRLYEQLLGTSNLTEAQRELVTRKLKESTQAPSATDRCEVPQLTV